MNAANFMPDDVVIAGIRQHFEAYEAERHHANRAVQWRVPLYLALFGATVVLLALLLNVSAGPAGQWFSFPHLFLYLGAFFGAFFVYSLARRPVTSLQSNFRKRVLPIVFGFVKGMRHVRGGTPASLANLPGATVGKFDTIEIDDFISGNYEGFSFELYETVLLRHFYKTYTTVFQGVIVAFELEKHFPGVLVATLRRNPVTGFIRDIFAGLETVESGHAVLDRAYDFRTDNVEAAQPLVSGQMVQALTLLVRNWPDGLARIALTGSEGFLLLPHGKDFFELPPSTKALDYKAHIEPMIADLVTMLATAALVRKIGA